MSGSWSPQDFPALTDMDYIGTSPQTGRYNCIAWSVGETNKKWWPDQWGIGAWFAGVDRIETVAGFIHGYKSRGYEECSDGSLEHGLEKIALYAKPDSPWSKTPTHAAYQLENGNWTSKLGDFEDIEHFELGKLDGPTYGAVVCFLKRPRQNRPSPPNH
jgi:hypothetical protein